MVLPRSPTLLLVCTCSLGLLGGFASICGTQALRCTRSGSNIPLGTPSRSKMHLLLLQSKGGKARKLLYLDQMRNLTGDLQSCHRDHHQEEGVGWQFGKSHGCRFLGLWLFSVFDLTGQE